MTSGGNKFKNICEILVNAGKTSKDYKNLKEISKINGTTLMILKSNTKVNDIQDSSNGEEIQTNGIGSFLLKGVSKIGSFLSNRRKKKAQDKSSLADACMGATMKAPGPIGTSNPLQSSNDDTKEDIDKLVEKLDNDNILYESL